MYDVLIGEDEKIEREYLKHMIEESELEIGKVYLAANGQEAVSIYKEHPCSIILMDINMPKMNGLDALREIRKIQQQESICYILTSYNYFSYAQEAIHLHVEDFILKPADIQIILGNIAKAIDILRSNLNHYQQTSALVEKINYTRPILETECAHLILTGQNELAIQKHCKALNIHFQTGFCIIIDKPTIKEENLEKLKKEIEDLGVTCLMTAMKTDIVIFVIVNRILHEQDITEIHKIIFQYAKFYGTGSIQNDVESLYQSYMHAIIDKQNTTDQKQNVIPQGYQNEVNDWIRLIMDCLEPGGEEQLKQCIKELSIDSIHKEKIELHSGDCFLQEVLEGLLQKLKDQYDIEVEYQSIHIEKSQDKQMVEMDLFYKLYNLIRSAKLMKYQQMDHLTKKAVDYINANYNKQISLNDVADALHVSSFHLSRALKKNNGKNFTDILNDCRIKEAKRLIKKHVTLKEVAFQAGFRSQSYFAKAFKKAVGMSPKEYRNLF